MTNIQLSLDARIINASIVKVGENLKVHVGENEYLLEQFTSGRYRVRRDGKTIDVAAAYYKGVYYIDVDSMLFEILEPDAVAVSTEAAHAGQKDKIFAPMPGKIVKLLVKVGDVVEEKQPLVIVEAMKMENQVSSLAAGKVKTINFNAGDQVDTERAIIELELETK